MGAGLYLAIHESSAAASDGISRPAAQETRRRG